MKKFVVAVVVAMSIFVTGPIQAHSPGGYGGGHYYGHGGGYYGGYRGGGYYGGRYYGGWGWGLPFAAFATGALLTSAFYPAPHYYYDAPGYYGAPVYRPRVGYQSSRRTVAAVNSGLDLDVQAGLRTRGYYSGSLDGIYGPQTAEAVRRFQADSGIAVTGRINGDTLKALGL